MTSRRERRHVTGGAEKILIHTDVTEYVNLYQGQHTKSINSNLSPTDAKSRIISSLTTSMKTHRHTQNPSSSSCFFSSSSAPLSSQSVETKRSRVFPLLGGFLQSVGQVHVLGDVRQLVILFPLHAPVLEPDLDLAFREVESVGDLDAAPAREVLVVVELLLELQGLVASVGRSGAFAVLAICKHKKRKR